MGYDRLATRLSLIIYKLNQGERVTIDGLAKEFSVSKRTIERDIVRLNSFPIKKIEKEYFLDEIAYGKLGFNDIKKFAILSGIKSLYPSLTQQFLKDILHEKLNKAYIVQNIGHEDIQNKQNIFEELSQSIIKKRTIYFTYNKKIRVVNPYKLININAIWYLNATENEEIKTYTFSKIKNLKISDDEFIQNKKILEDIEKNEINFISKDHKEVQLKIENIAKDYFLRKKILQNMKIIDNTKDYFIVSTKISFDDEILNIVKQWIPYIKILSPIELRDKLKNTLEKYLKE